MVTPSCQLLTAVSVARWERARDYRLIKELWTFRDIGSLLASLTSGMTIRAVFPIDCNRQGKGKPPTHQDFSAA
jgi:hypothetical protein